jgi:hypothetical protein
VAPIIILMTFYTSAVASGMRLAVSVCVQAEVRVSLLPSEIRKILAALLPPSWYLAWGTSPTA